MRQMTTSLAVVGTLLLLLPSACKTGRAGAGVKDDASESGADTAEAGSIDVKFHCVETKSQDDDVDMVISGQSMKWGDQKAASKPFATATPNSKAFNRFSFDAPEGEGEILVPKAMFDAKAKSGQVKVQARGEGFFTELFACTRS